MTSDRTDISVTSARNFAVKKLASDENASVISNQNIEIQSQYLQDVGWMIKINDRKFQMMFNDGIHVSIDAKEQMLLFKGKADSQPERYVLESFLIYFRHKIDKKLPEKARNKLAYFPKFLKEMQRH
jgi:hypothetical protein